MKLAIQFVPPSVKLVSPQQMAQIAETIEYCGRLCHKTEELTGLRTDFFIRKVARKLQHESIEEHSAITFHFVGSRSFSHQLVRHRLNAISQESQRYCSYSHEKYKHCLQVICPPSILAQHDITMIHGAYVCAEATPDLIGEYTYLLELPTTPVPLYALGDVFAQYTRTLLHAYGQYLWLRDRGVPAEDARFVLPNATKTEVALTASVRQWRHIIKMRCDKHAQWEIRELMIQVLRILNLHLPACFEDLAEEYLNGHVSNRETS